MADTKTGPTPEEIELDGMLDKLLAHVGVLTENIHHHHATTGQSVSHEFDRAQRQQLEHKTLDVLIARDQATNGEWQE